MNTDTDPADGEYPVVDGTIYGGVGYIAGYLTTLLLVFLVEDEGIPGDIIEGAGWVYYNAQFVDIVPRGAPGGASTASSINYVTGSGLGGSSLQALTVPSVVYHLIPVVAFVAAGFALVRTVGATTPTVGAKIGASLVLGCLFLSLAGTFTFEVGGRVALGPSRLTSLLFVGILYPAICGGVGGATATLVD
jgi:hypothetical protein